MNRYSDHTHDTLEQENLSTLERDWEESSRGKAAKSSMNINLNMVDYEGLTELSPLGLPQLYVELSATLGNL
jgi:hypothetical protein